MLSDGARELASAWCCLVLLACGASEQPETAKVVAGERGAGRQDPKATLSTLLSFEVSAPQADADLLKAICAQTGLEPQTKGGVVSCGPLLSRYEAAVLAGLVPGGVISERDTFPEPATSAPWDRVRAPYGRETDRVMTRQLLNGRYALVEWRLADDAALATRVALERSDRDTDFGPVPEPTPGEEPPQTQPTSFPLAERELYQIDGRSPRFIAKLPLLDAFNSSTGFGLARFDDETTFLQVVEKRQTREGKSENLIGWRWSVQGREKVFESGFVDYRVPAKEQPTLTVTRITPTTDGLQLKRYRISLKLKPGVAASQVLWNDWESPTWKQTSPLPHLVELVSVETIGESTETLGLIWE